MAQHSRQVSKNVINPNNNTKIKTKFGVFHTKTCLKFCKLNNTLKNYILQYKQNQPRKF